MPRVVWNEPGETWENGTDKVAYQFICDLVNTCGRCLQYHMAISSSLWPLPLHTKCRCNQSLIRPGGKGKKFVDFRELLDELPMDQKVAAIGKSSYKLLEAGKVKWEDIVTPGRVRTFREVVSRENFTVKQLVDAGVKESQALKAFESVHTPRADMLAKFRSDLIKEIQGAGVSKEEIKARFAEAMATRVKGIGGRAAFEVVPAEAKEARDLTKIKAMLDERILKNLGVSVKKVETVAPQAIKISPIKTVTIPAENTKTVERIKSALKSIDKVIQVPGDTPKIPVMTADLGESTRGQYVVIAKDGKKTPRRIVISSKEDKEYHKTLTTAHEYAHFIDHAVIPGGEDNERNHANDPIFKEWIGAVKGSKAVKAIEASLEKSEKVAASIKKFLGEESNIAEHEKYLLQTNELWARSCAQWFAVKSGNPEMTKELEGIKTADQWSDKDFAPIATAIDGIFRGLGLLK